MWEGGGRPWAAQALPVWLGTPTGPAGTPAPAAWALRVACVLLGGAASCQGPRDQRGLRAANRADVTARATGTRHTCRRVCGLYVGSNPLKGA